MSKKFLGGFLFLVGAALLVGMIALATPTQAGPPEKVPPRPIPAPVYDEDCKRPCPLWLPLHGGYRCRFVGCFVETGECAYRC